MAGAIQDRINQEIANIPIFYGQPEKDTVTLKHYISRVDQGVTQLEWTQATAFTYFSNSLKGTAANWLDTHLSDNRNIVKHWSVLKPAFRRALGDVTDPVVFAQQMGNIKIGTYSGNLYDYYAAITKMINLHTEKYLAATIVLPQGHGMTEEQRLIVTDAVTHAIHAVHDDFKKEFFINGLTTAQTARISNKPQLETASQILEFLKREEDIERNKLAPAQPPASAPAAGIAPISGQQETIQANNNYRGSSRGTSYRGQSRGGNGYRGRGNANRGGNGGYSGNSGNGNGASGNPAGGNSNSGRTELYCAFCRKTNHKQETCYERIRQKQPCVSNSGKPYFPKSDNPTAAPIIPEPDNSIQSNSVFFNQV